VSFISGFKCFIYIISFCPLSYSIARCHFSLNNDWGPRRCTGGFRQRCQDDATTAHDIYRSHVQCSFALSRLRFSKPLGNFLLSTFPTMILVPICTRMSQRFGYSETVGPRNLPSCWGQSLRTTDTDSASHS